MKIILSCLLLLLFTATGNAEDAVNRTSEIQSFKAGGTPINIVSPTSDMTEVGYDNREFMEIFVPSSNRLIAAFVMNKDLPNLIKGGDSSIFSTYALVEVPRNLEYMDCGSNDFKVVTESVKEEVGNMDSSMKESEDEFNRRMKSLNLDDAKVSIGKTIQLGCLFSKQDAYGFGMIMPVSTSADTIRMGMGCSFIRVKNRLIFLYLYSEYNNEDTVKWLRKTTEEWADVILKTNK